MENQGSSICFHRFLELRIASLRMKICCLREENFNLEKLGFQEIINPVSFSSLTSWGFCFAQIWGFVILDLQID
ncbi:hypothetical protein ACFXTO_006761 [Malus domestica]